MNISIKLLSRNWKILKNNQQKTLSSNNFGEYFRTFKKRMYVKEPCQVYTCTKFQVDNLKNARVLAFLRSKTAIFHAISGDFRIFPIFKICPIWAVQKMF